jgi:hypothetical protein
MYDFAVVALLALATMKVVDFVGEHLGEVVERFSSLLTFVVGVGAVVWLDFSVFAGWNIEIRNDDLGVWLTGFIVAGGTVAWKAILGWLGGFVAAVDVTPAVEGGAELSEAA